MDYKEKIIALLNSQELSKEQKEKLENIFPELKESEDERIREALIEMVHDTTGDSLWIDYNVHKEDALAWLEKQGEQKSINDLTQQEAMDIAVTKCFEQGEQKPNPCDGCVNRKGCINCENGELREVEQKPAEWNRNDRKHIEKLITIVDASQHKEEVEWLVSLLERTIPQPKPAWSEEDEKRLSDAIFFVREYQIPTRDKRLLNAAKETEDWLRTLKDRYTWRPSDGQLECLGYAIEKAEKDWSPLTNNRIYLILKALKEQLLELRESKE